MNSLKIISKENYRRATWKNGLGYTDEIAIYPQGAQLKNGDFLWRLSSAKIDKASPFSVFPNHDRGLVIIKGPGLRLTHEFEAGSNEEDVEVLPYSPYEFPGDVPSRCELMGESVTDLSVFVRKAQADMITNIVEVTSEEPFDWMPEGRWNFAYAAQGHFEVKSFDRGEVKKLLEGETLQIDLSEPLSNEQQIKFSLNKIGSGKLVVISLQG